MPISRETKLRENRGQIPSEGQSQRVLTAPPQPLQHGHTSGFGGHPVLYCCNALGCTVQAHRKHRPSSTETDKFIEVLERADHQRINKSHRTFTEPTGGQGPGWFSGMILTYTRPSFVSETDWIPRTPSPASSSPGDLPVWAGRVIPPHPAAQGHSLFGNDICHWRATPILLPREAVP